MPDWIRFVRDHLPVNCLKREREEEVIAELAQQLEDSYQEALAAGSTEEEAAESARCQIQDWETLARDISGGRPGSRRAAIDRWCEQAETAAHAPQTRRNPMGRLFADLRHDLLYGIRILLKNRGFTTTALITLAFGIGINTAVFSVVNAMISIPQQYPGAEALVYFWGTKSPGTRQGGISVADAMDCEARSNSFSEFSVFRSRTKTWRGTADAERVRSLEATASLFSMLGVGPSLGRLFPVPGDTEAEPVVVVTDNFWRTKLGADPGIIGKAYALDGVYHVVIGVLEPTRKLMQLAHFDFDLLTPLARDAGLENREERSCQVLARLRPGVLPSMAQAEVDAIAAGMARAHPDTNADRGFRLETLADRLVRPADRLGGLALILAVTAVLLIACINLAGMLLAKATKRTREFAIRLALGAGRMRIMRQLIAESLLLALGGGLLGLWLAHGALRVFLQSLEDAPITMQDLGPNVAVLLYTLGISLATSAVFGLAPAAMLSRIPAADAIKEAGATGLRGLSHNRLRQTLVVTELAIGLPLLICCGLAVRNVLSLSTIELGFASRNLVTMYAELPHFRYPEKERWPTTFQGIITRMQALPGVQAAGATLSFPVGGAHYRLVVRARLEDSPKQGADPSPYLSCQPVTSGYFETMGIPLLSGRRFGAQDRAGSAPVAMINRQMAWSYFETLAAEGRSMTLDPGTPDERQVTIVGIVGDSGRGIFGEPAAPEVYLPYAQCPMPGMVLVVRTAGDPMQLVPELRRSLQALDPEIPISEVQTVPEIVHRWLRDDRLLALFLAILAALSLALAGLGLYGVMSYTVNQRTHEFGVRVALGADAGEIVRLVLRQCCALSLTGLGIGFVLALPVALLLGSQFYGVSGIDPLTFAGVSALLLAVGLLAGYFPARRATRVDPIQALRHE